MNLISGGDFNTPSDWIAISGASIGEGLGYLWDERSRLSQAVDFITEVGESYRLSVGYISDIESALDIRVIISGVGGEQVLNQIYSSPSATDTFVADVTATNIYILGNDVNSVNIDDISVEQITTTVIKVRETGGDCSGWDGLNAILTPLFPLSGNIDIQIQGGYEITATGFICPVQGVWSGYSMTFRTDPTEISTPARIRSGTGGILYQRFITINENFEADTRIINFQNLKLTFQEGPELKNTFFQISISQGYTTLNVDNCILVDYKVSGEPWLWLHVHDQDYERLDAVFKNCTLIFNCEDNSDETQDANIFAERVIFHNCLIVSYKETGNGELKFYAKDVEHKNNTFFNYGDNTTYPFKISAQVGAGGTWPNIISGSNPNLVDTPLINYTDSAQVIASRNMRLTTDSIAISANADPATALSIDIVGTTRPQNIIADRGAYEYIVIPPEPTPPPIEVKQNSISIGIKVIEGRERFAKGT